MKIYRQGDILISPIGSIPEDAQPRNDLVLARGEITGHVHRVVMNERAELFEFSDEMFLRVLGGPADIVHDEHATIKLQPGNYRVWRQREYNPGSYEEFIED